MPSTRPHRLTSRTVAAPAVALAAAACFALIACTPGDRSQTSARPPAANAASQNSQNSPAPQAAQADIQAFADSATRFAGDLHQQLRAEPGNLFFSPYSVHAALSMTLAGARGETASQMRHALALPGDDAWPQHRLHPSAAGLADRLQQAAGDKGVQLAIANSLWPSDQLTLQPDFTQALRQHYGVSVTPVAYPEPGRVRINQWVEKQTRERIKDLLQPGMLNRDTMLVLVNAIYFKGDWLRPFEPDRTADMPFHLSPGRTIDVPMMRQRGRFMHHAGDGFALVELPYAGEKLAMVVLLPDAGGGLDDLEARLSPALIDQTLEQAHEREIDLILPRFTMTWEATLNEPLMAMGMVDAFANDADLTGMADREDLYISLVRHKAFVEVNEVGSEAAAATAVGIARLSAPLDPPPVFRADRPFVFLIRHRETGVILFLGRLADPRS